jgi:hypothetical protein
MIKCEKPLIPLESKLSSNKSDAKTIEIDNRIEVELRVIALNALKALKMSLIVSNDKACVQQLTHP